MRKPKYRRQPTKGGDRGFAVYQHNRVYFGLYDDPASKRAYEEWVEELELSKIVAKRSKEGKASPVELTAVTVDHLLDQYLSFVETRFGQDSYDMSITKGVVRHTAEYHSWPIRNFGPQTVFRIRDALVAETSLSAGTINRFVNRIKRIWKWGVPRGLVPADNYHQIDTVEPLAESDVPADRRSKEVLPVEWDVVELVKDFVTPTIWAMVQLQFFTGMRSDEVCGLNLGELNMDGDVWIYDKQQHKNRHRKKKKLVYIGPRAQEAISRYVTAASRNEGTFVFTPAQSMAEHQEKRDANRKTKRYGQRARNAGKPRSDLQPRYNQNSYRRAIERGITAARNAWLEKHKSQLPKPEDAEVAIPSWHPHQLRHTRATINRKDYGVEGAAATTGNTIKAAQVYAEQSAELAERIARETG